MGCCNCSSSSCSSSSFCGACPPATTAANCHGITFKNAEKPSRSSDINRSEKFYSIIIIFFWWTTSHAINLLFVSCNSEVTDSGTTIANNEDPPPKKKKLSNKATQLEEKVVPVLSLVELDKEISEYKGCSDSSCFKDCRGGCLGKNFMTKDEWFDETCSTGKRPDLSKRRNWRAIASICSGGTVPIWTAWLAPR